MEDLDVLIERYRREIRNRHVGGESSGAVHDDDEAFLIVDPETWRDHSPGLCTGLYLKGAPGEYPVEDIAALTEEYRVMCDLPRLDSHEGVAAFLEYLSAGVDLFRQDETCPDPEQIMGRIVERTGVSPWLVRSAPSDTAVPAGGFPASVVTVLHDDSVSRGAAEALNAGDASPLVEAISRLPDLNREMIFFVCSLPGGLELLPPHQQARMIRAAHGPILAMGGLVGLRVPLPAGEDSVEALLMEGYNQLLLARIALLTGGGRRVRIIPSGEARLLIVYHEGEDAALCLHNVSGDSAEFRDRHDRYLWPENGVLRDILSGDLVFPAREGAFFSLELQPWEIMWLRFT